MLPDTANFMIDTFFLTADWIYTYVESLTLYDFQIIYFWVWKNIFNGSVEHSFIVLSFLSMIRRESYLFWSNLHDSHVFLYLSQVYFTDEWFKSFLASREASFFFIYHPELVYVKHQLLHTFFLNFVTEFNFSLIDYLEKKSLITPVMLFPQYCLLLFYIFIFTSLFFSYFSTPSKEESTIDSDYLVASSTVEAEEEIGSLDDLVMPVICLTYVFGWICYLNSYHLLIVDSSFTIVWSLIPLLYYVVINTPTTILLDFGGFYICCLRGVAPTSCLIFELVYDIIALIAFYVRVLVQGVRLALICYAYISLHDFVVHGNFNLIGGNYPSFWEDFAKIDSSECTFTYFIIMYLPHHIFEWLYELVHVFFVLTGQLLSYLAMLFWLFLFLFTFFAAYKQEQFFEERREFRMRMLDKYKSLLLNKQSKNKK